MTKIFRILAVTLFAMQLRAADTQGEIATLNEALHRTSAAGDVDAYVKLLTDDYHAISRTGDVRDLKATVAVMKSRTTPADLKNEVISTSIYGDTVIQIIKQSWTTADGAKMDIRTSRVFVRQNGAWKLAFNSSATVAPQNQK